jgi:hypothetical protein
MLKALLIKWCFIVSIISFKVLLVPGVEVDTDPITRKMVLSLYGQDKLTVTFGIEQKGNQEIIFQILEGTHLTSS